MSVLVINESDLLAALEQAFWTGRTTVPSATGSLQARNIREQLFGRGQLKVVDLPSEGEKTKTYYGQGSAQGIGLTQGIQGVQCINASDAAGTAEGPPQVQADYAQSNPFKPKYSIYKS